MPVSLAHWIVLVAGVYLAIGLAFALLFVIRWAGRVDPAARNGTIGFRLLIIPGSALLWPFLAGRLLRGSTEPPEERNAHRVAARQAGHP
jgi:fatty acid desaturase